MKIVDENEPIKMAVIFDQIIEAGGGYQQALNAAILVNKINKKYCNPLFFTTYRENITTLHDHNINVIFLNIPRWRRLFLKIRGAIPSRRLLTIIIKLIGFNSFEKPLLEREVDLVYFISPSIWALYLERLNFISTVWDLCHRDYPEFPEVRADHIFENREQGYRQYLIKSTAILTDSNLGKENIISRYGVDKNRVHIIPFSAASHIENFANKKIDRVINIREKYGIDDEYIIYPAKFWPHKNHVYILHGLNLLYKNYGVSLKAVFVGSDGLAGTLEYVKKTAEKIGILDNIFFLGYVEDEDLAYLYKESIALVMPTYFGPTNIPPLEAFTLGVPVLYSNLDGLREQVGDAALLMDLNNPESMASHLDRLINDDDLKNNLTIKGRAQLNKYDDKYRLKIIEGICIDFQSKRYSWGSYK